MVEAEEEVGVSMGREKTDATETFWHAEVLSWIRVFQQQEQEGLIRRSINKRVATNEFESKYTSVPSAYDFQRSELTGYLVQIHS